ncbi:MAG TPA: DUF4331 family protein [Xanthomonadaceae bacterium]|nr:DUF4331 family protein [Xanthomonadaceae bacterium]
MTPKYLPLTLAALLLGGAAMAADHADSPITVRDPAADLLDLYAFVNPVDPGETILVMTTFNNAGFTSQFSDAVEYRFHIDNGAGDSEILCLFPTPGRVQCTGPNDLSVSGQLGRTETNGDMRVWAGLRDDPFFFDGAAFNATRATGQPQFCMPGQNTFTGNVLAVVVGVRSAQLTNNGANPVLSMWLSTRRVGDLGVGPGISGSWFDLAQPGFGAFVQYASPSVAEPQLGPRLNVGAFFPDTPEGNGEQFWVIGTGFFDTAGSTAAMTAVRASGGGVPGIDFDPGSVDVEAWGTLVFEFESCEAGTMSAHSEDGSISFSVPIGRLTTIDQLACDFFVGGQVDRAGRPAINPATIGLIPSAAGNALKDAYNQADNPAQWAQLFTDEMTENLSILAGLDGNPGNVLLPPATLASVLVDDRLRIDTSKPMCDQYLAVELNVANDCGGRTLERDVIDDTLSAAVGPGVSDCVGNDSVFLEDFPYLGPPIL